MHDALSFMPDPMTLPKIVPGRNVTSAMARLRPNSLAAGIAELAPEEGRNATRYPGAILYHLTAAEPPTPTLYPASLILVGSGEKRGILAGDTFVYDPRHYLVVTSPLPMLCQTLATPRTPVLSLMVDVDLDILRELLLAADDRPLATPHRTQRSVYRAPLVPALEDAGRRLLEHLRSDRCTRALARQTVRELLFHVLEGPYGDALRALAHGPTGELGRVMRYLAAHFAERITIEELARQAHMSVPTFHHHFKAMTATSPLQYIKALRLTRARRMIQLGSTAKHAARDVGYESESQFSREFRRFFGSTPSACMQRAAE